MSNEIKGLDRPAITLAAGEGRADSSLRKLTIRGQPFYVLKQRGSYPDMAYDHGRLLAKQIDAGAFPEIIATIMRGVDLDSDRLSKVAAAVYRTYSDRVLDNVSAEFRQAIEGLADGYFAGMDRPRFSRTNVRDALIAIEVGNLVDGLGRILEFPGVRVLELIALLPAILAKMDDAATKTYMKRAKRDARVQRSVGKALAGMTGPNTRIDFACTSFAAPGSMTRDGRHLHARNLDADLYNWNKAPLLFLCDETGGRPGWHKYVAFGTAGLIYPGGISGVNDAGISVALHQMSTTEYDSTPSDRADIAPYVEQRILREAGTLDEAADLVKDSNHFAAWTFVCTDAKSGKTRRIEVTGERVRVGPVTSGPFAQTNHFFHPDLVERHFDEDDAHYVPTFAKWLDTHARYKVAQTAVNKKRRSKTIDVQWAIERQCVSHDGLLEEVRRGLGRPMPVFSAERAYNRVPRKAYGQLGSIVVADPKRRNKKDEVWMTTGDTLPTPQSSFVGWQVDWRGFDLAPVKQTPLRRTQQYPDSNRANWESALPLYVQARIAIARPRGTDGELLQRGPTKAEDRKNHVQAVSLLNQAIALAAKDRMVEVPYHYMRARLRGELGYHKAAKADWDLLRDVWAKQNGLTRVAEADWPVAAPRNGPLLLPYEAAYIAILAVDCEDRVQRNKTWRGRKARLAAARKILNGIKRELFTGKPLHFDLKRWLERLDKLDKGEKVEFRTPDFVSAE